MPQKILRAIRSESYEDYDEYFQNEYCRDGKPDKGLSCNKIENHLVERALTEYKATYMRRPLTKGISGIFLNDQLQYTHKPLEEKWFSLVQDTHYTLNGPDNLTCIAKDKFNKPADIALTKEAVWSFIDGEEKSNNPEWIKFLNKNPEWGKKLESYRKQRKAHFLREWQRFSGGSIKDKHIKKILDLEPEKARFLLQALIDVKAYEQSDLERLQEYLS